MNKGEIIDDMSLSEKQRSTIDDLLDRFAELRKNELLTPEMMEELRRGYN
jgi:putative ABC transport system ATP-binding protein